MWQGVGVTQGGLCEVDHARWVTRGGSREVDMRWIMQGGLCKFLGGREHWWVWGSHKVDYVRWITQDGLCEVVTRWVM